MGEFEAAFSGVALFFASGTDFGLRHKRGENGVINCVI
jgi:hypothetical protein